MHSKFNNKHPASSIPAGKYVIKVVKKSLINELYAKLILLKVNNKDTTSTVLS